MDDPYIVPCSNLSVTDRSSCHIDTVHAGQLDAVAGIRLISSCLGLIGSLSIITSALAKRRVLNCEVHPIFMLSLSDSILAVLWIIGSALWLVEDGSYNRLGCFAITVLTMIFESISINLTLTYAIFAYARIRRSSLHTLMSRAVHELTKRFILSVYSVAWILPIIVTLLIFGIIQGSVNFLAYTEQCSCWCVPSAINIMPFAVPDNLTVLNYVHRQFKLLVGMGAVLLFNYVSVFVALSVIYVKILRKIKKLREEHDDYIYGHGRSSRPDTAPSYGTTETSRIVHGQTQARKKVVIFLSVFLLNGFFNIVLLGLVIAFLSPHFHQIEKFAIHHSPAHATTYHIFLYAQAVTLPIQGFFNAIAYGWTRDDFLQAVSLKLEEEHENVIENDTAEELEESGTSVTSGRFQDTIGSTSGESDITT